VDPNVTLCELRSLVRAVQTGGEVSVPADALSAMAQLFDDLDTFLLQGGFYPQPWEENRVTVAKAFKMVHAAIAIRPQVTVTDVAEMAAKAGVRL